MKVTVKARCLDSKYNPQLINTIGMAIGDKDKDNAMFYPDNSKPVYRVVVPWTNLEIIEED